MRLMMEPCAPFVDEGVSAVQGGAAYLTDIERRLAPSVERAAPRQRAMASRQGLLSPAARTHSWPWAVVSGATTPDALQHLRRRALWDPEAVCEARRRDVRPQLADPNAVLVLDETGLLKQGRHSAGVARQDSGTAGRVEHCQSGVLLGYASPLGPTVLDRELSLPQEWTDDHDRYQQAGIPEDQRLATTPQLARPMMPRARTTGIPATWVTGDRVSGDERRLRRWLAAQPPA